MRNIFKSRAFRFAAVGIFFGLALAACSNGSGGLYGGSGGSPAAQATSSGSTTVGTSSISGLGTAVAAPNGLTLYMLSADKSGTPTCVSSPCTTQWPPLMVSSASALKAQSGVKMSMLGTVPTPSGDLQVTYGGWPVYEYIGDTGPGTASGEKIQAFGGTWFAVGSSGKPLGASAAGSSGSAGSSGGSSGGGW